MISPVEQVMKIHQEMLKENAYCYFELAYTRYTEWMVWICSNAREQDPNRKVLLKGQGSTPDEACLDALVAYESGKTFDSYDRGIDSQSYEENRKKAEDEISKGARITKHRIDL